MASEVDINQPPWFSEDQLLRAAAEQPEAFMLQEQYLEMLNSPKPEPDGGAKFLHCKECLQDFYDDSNSFGNGQSPKEALSYEAAAMTIARPDHVREWVVVILCKRCGKEVWNSRHLTNIVIVKPDKEAKRGEGGGRG